MLHQFISRQIGHGGSVVLVGLLQIFSHYAHIGRKLGYNLHAARNDSRLVFIDGLALTERSGKCGMFNE